MTYAEDTMYCEDCTANYRFGPCKVHQGDPVVRSTPVESDRARAGLNGWATIGTAAAAPRTRTYTPCTGTNCQMEITAAVLNGRCEGFDDGYAAAVEHFHAAQSMGFEWAAPTCERCGKGSLSAICYDCSQVTEDNASE